MIVGWQKAVITVRSNFKLKVRYV